MRDPTAIWHMVISGTIGLALLLLVVSLTLEDHSRLRLNWRTGIVLGLLWFLLGLPAQIFVMTQVDVQAVLEQTHIPAENAGLVVMALYIGLILGFTISVVKIAWYMLVYHAAAVQWSELRPDPFPLLQRRGRAPWAAIGGAAAFGVAAGGISAAVLKLLGVSTSDALKVYTAFGPSAANAGLYVRLPVLVLAVSGAALAEELLFRGVLFGWLLRLSRNRTAGIVLATVLVSLVWALVHLPNTDAPWIKCGQIFLISMVLCEFARRWCLEAAIAAHVGLNVAALLISAAIA